MVKNVFSLLIANFFIVSFFFLSNAHFNQIDISFDSLFPITWYQKGLNSSIHVWRALSDVLVQNHKDASLISWDYLLGRLTFVQFCINRMHQENDFLLEEDNVYFSVVIHKIQKLITALTVSIEAHDSIACAHDILQTMQKSLQKYHNF